MRYDRFRLANFQNNGKSHSGAPNKSLKVQPEGILIFKQSKIDKWKTGNYNSLTLAQFQSDMTDLKNDSKNASKKLDLQKFAKKLRVTNIYGK